MRKILCAASAAVLVCAWASAGVAKEVTRTIPVDDNFVDGIFQWDSGHSMDYRAQIIVVEGVIEFCGAVMHRGGSNYRRVSNQALNEAKFMMNGKSIVRDFRFFALATTTKPWQGQMANCVSSGVAAPSNQPSFDIKFRDGRYKERR